MDAEGSLALRKAPVNNGGITTARRISEPRGKKARYHGLLNAVLQLATPP